MSLSLGGLMALAGRTGSSGSYTPTLLGAPSVKSDGSNPTFTAHLSGDLLVSGVCNHNTHSGTAPSAAAPFSLLDSFVGGTNYASAIYSTIASAAGTTISWSNASMPRVAWALRNAQIDKFDAFGGASSTSITIPTLSGMAPNCFVGVVLMTRAAQTSIQTSALATALTGMGLTIRTQRNTVPAYIVLDSDTTLLSSFAPSAANIDTASSGHAGFVFSVKGAS